MDKTNGKTYFCTVDFNTIYASLPASALPELSILTASWLLNIIATPFDLATEEE